MRGRNLYTIERKLHELGNPIITGRQLSLVAGLGLRTAHLYLHRMAAKGMVRHVERGKYAVAEDAFAVASALAFPSYLSFAPALSLHQALDQVVDQVLVVSPIRRRDLQFLDSPIHFVTMRPRFIFGYHKARRGEFEVALGDIEKIVLDILLMPRYGRLNLIPKLLQEKADPAVLEDYNAQLGVEAVSRRLGYLQEYAGLRTRIKPRTRAVYSLNPTLATQGKLDRKWRLFVNEDLS